MSYMGIDIGTTGCKAGVFDDRGRLLALSYREYPLASPRRGWAELDSRLVMDQCEAVIREAAASVGGDAVAALGISCQGEAFTPLDNDGGYMCGAMVSSDARAASIVRPWSEEVQKAKQTGDSVYGLILAEMPSDPTDLDVLPYFTPSGTPYFDAKVPGAVLGLRLDTTRGQLLRGLLEGVAMEMRLNVDILDRAGLAINEFRAIGGGAKSPRLAQLKADVLGRPITTLEVTEAGCLGVVMLACAAHRGSGNGNKNTLRELADIWVKPTSTVEPDEKRARRYTEKFERYKQLYPTLGKLY